MLNRAELQLKERGMESFFEKRRGRTGGPVLTADKLMQSQALLNRGLPRSKVAAQRNMKSDTLRKAISDGRLTEPEKVQTASTMSERTPADALSAAKNGFSFAGDQGSFRLTPLPGDQDF